MRLLMILLCRVMAGILTIRLMVQLYRLMIMVSTLNVSVTRLDGWLIMV